MLYEMLVGAPPFYSENKKEIFRKIMNLPIPMPSFVTEEARAILSRLLVVDPLKRLGSKGDAKEIMTNKFFVGIDFEEIKKR